ncbi:uncharacterized protein A4U43_C08F17750 [Asparagus officinalis]|nr:uncharacterized protein A4U43_C08F17750 [Asparagus officinalis]
MCGRGMNKQGTEPSVDLKSFRYSVQLQFEFWFKSGSNWFDLVQPGSRLVQPGSRLVQDWFKTGSDWFILVWSGLVWFGLVQPGLAWFSLLCTDLDWSGLVQPGPIIMSHIPRGRSPTVSADGVLPSYAVEYPSRAFSSHAVDGRRDEYYSTSDDLSPIPLTLQFTPGTSTEVAQVVKEGRPTFYLATLSEIRMQCLLTPSSGFIKIAVVSYICRRFLDTAH